MRFTAERKLSGRGQEKEKTNTPLARLTEQLKDAGEQNRLSAIMTKMRTGKRLTRAEKSYLKEKSPDMYRKYQMVEAERNEYGKQLRQAKSKGDAQKLHQMKLATLYNESNSAAASADSEIIVCRTAAAVEEYREYATRGKKRRQDEGAEPLGAGQPRERVGDGGADKEGADRSRPGKLRASC